MCLWVCVHVCVVHMCERFPGLSHWVSFTLLAGCSPRQVRCCPAGSGARLTWVDVQEPLPSGQAVLNSEGRGPLCPACAGLLRRCPPACVPSVARCHGSFRDLVELPAPRLAAAGLDVGTWDGGKRL